MHAVGPALNMRTTPAGIWMFGESHLSQPDCLAAARDLHASGFHVSASIPQAKANAAKPSRHLLPLGHAPPGNIQHPLLTRGISNTPF